MMKNFIKEYFKKSIDKMAKENEKTFGNTKNLDCCGLNKPISGTNNVNNKNK